MVLNCNQRNQRNQCIFWLQNSAPQTDLQNKGKGGGETFIYKYRYSVLMMKPDNYTISSPTWGANEYLKGIIDKMTIGEKMKISAIYLDIFSRHAISKNFVKDLISEYVDVEILKYEDESKKTVIKMEQLPIEK